MLQAPRCAAEWCTGSGFATSTLGAGAGATCLAILAPGPFGPYSEPQSAVIVVMLSCATSFPWYPCSGKPTAVEFLAARAATFGAPRTTAPVTPANKPTKPKNAARAIVLNLKQI